MSTTKSTITVVAIAYNEEEMMPFFLNHYSKFCEHIVIYDNHSTDNTEKICNAFDKCKVTVVKYDTNNTLNDEKYLEIKNNVYRDYDTDYCIVVDSDEFLYHENMKDFLLQYKEVSVFKPQGYNMISEEFPKGGDILEVKTGVPEINYCKKCLFKIKDIGRINYIMGCHAGDFYDNNGNMIEPVYNSDLKLLHYKNLSFEYRYNRSVLFEKRMSEFNRSTGFGIHYTFTRDRQLTEFNALLSQATKVI